MRDTYEGTRSDPGKRTERELPEHGALRNDAGKEIKNENENAPDRQRTGAFDVLLSLIELQSGHNGDDHGAALGVFKKIIADRGFDCAPQLTVVPAALAGDGFGNVHGDVLKFF